jgi:hypothetical protein
VLNLVAVLGTEDSTVVPFGLSQESMVTTFPVAVKRFGWILRLFGKKRLFTKSLGNLEREGPWGSFLAPMQKTIHRLLQNLEYYSIGPLVTYFTGATAGKHQLGSRLPTPAFMFHLRISDC